MDVDKIENKGFGFLNSQFALKVLSVSIIIIFFSIFGNMFILLSFLEPQFNSFENKILGQRRYTIVDNFFDSDEFLNYRKNAQKMNFVGDFYNQLNKSEKINLLSIFDQFVYINDFKGDSTFYYDSEILIDGSEKVAVNAIQMNYNAFEYYGLTVQKGNVEDWNSLTYVEDSIPVLLGKNYIGIYNVGDCFNGYFYNREIEFKVVGILSETSFIYYKTEAEFVLDNYVVIPYPSEAWNIQGEDFVLEGILYFAMINCDIVTSVTQDEFIKEIKTIADDSGFVEFSIVGVDEFLIKNIILLFKIRENKILILISVLILMITTEIVLYKIEKIIFKSVGELSKRNEIKRNLNNLLRYLFSLILALMLQVIFFKRIFLLAIYIQGSLWLIMISLIFIFLKRNQDKSIDFFRIK